jgi:hypothetical protein
MDKGLGLSLSVRRRFCIFTQHLCYTVLALYCQTTRAVYKRRIDDRHNKVDATRRDTRKAHTLIHTYIRTDWCDNYIVLVITLLYNQSR